MLSSTAVVVVLAAAAAQTVSAHFGLTYPTWRADTLSGEDNSPYSQWTYPCKWRLPLHSNTPHHTPTTHTNHH